MILVNECLDEKCYHLMYTFYCSTSSASNPTCFRCSFALSFFFCLRFLFGPVLFGRLWMMTTITEHLLPWKWYKNKNLNEKCCLVVEPKCPCCHFIKTGEGWNWSRLCEPSDTVFSFVRCDLMLCSLNCSKIFIFYCILLGGNYT